MKSIVFVTIAMGGGGSERIISILANSFVKLGYKVTIVMIAGNTVSYELSSSIELISIGGSSGGSTILRLKRIHKMRKIFSQRSYCNIIAMGTVASIFSLIANFGLNNNIIVSERNNPNRINGKPYSKMMSLVRDCLYGFADMCVFQTYDAKDYFSKINKNRKCVIPNPIPEGMVEAYRGKREKIVVTAGRLIEEKNHEMLINAFAKFYSLHDEYRLKIYGSGVMKDRLQGLINSLDLCEAIEIIDFNPNLHDMIKTCGMYVSSSNGEGMSNAVMEALALGIPTIATDCPIGGSKMCIEDGINGFLIPVGDEQMLTEKMCQIAESEKLQDFLSTNAVKIRQKYSLDIVIKMWLDLLR